MTTTTSPTQLQLPAAVFPLEKVHLISNTQIVFVGKRACVYSVLDQNHKLISNTSHIIFPEIHNPTYVYKIRGQPVLVHLVTKSVQVKLRAINLRTGKQFVEGPELKQSKQRNFALATSMYAKQLLIQYQQVGEKKKARATLQTISEFSIARLYTNKIQVLHSNHLLVQIDCCTGKKTVSNVPYGQKEDVFPLRNQQVALLMLYRDSYQNTRELVVLDKIKSQNKNYKFYKIPNGYTCLQVDPSLPVALLQSTSGNRPVLWEYRKKQTLKVFNLKNPDRSSEQVLTSSFGGLFLVIQADKCQSSVYLHWCLTLIKIQEYRKILAQFESVETFSKDFEAKVLGALMGTN